MIVKDDSQPLIVIFLEKVQQEWERQQAQLDELVDEAIRNENSLFNPNILCEPQIPDVQPVNNTPRWIQLPNEEPLFTNGRLT